MGANRSREVHECAELLHLARACYGQEPSNRTLAVGAARAKHDLSPLNGGAERPFGRGMPRAGLCRVGVNRTLLLGGGSLVRARRCVGIIRDLPRRPAMGPT